MFDIILQTKKMQWLMNGDNMVLDAINQIRLFVKYNVGSN